MLDGSQTLDASITLVNGLLFDAYSLWIPDSVFLCSLQRPIVCLV